MAMTPEESYELAINGAPTDGDFAASGETAEEPTFDPAATPEAPAPAAEEPAPRINPNWEEAWKDVPEPIKAQQRAVFEKWDANFNALHAKHAPYAQYEQHGYNPEYITQAISIQQALINNPEEFVKKAISEFGLTIGEARQALAQAQDAAEETFLTPEEERLRRVEAQNQQLLENFTQRQQAEERYRIEQQNVAAIQGALANLHTKYGDFDEDRVVQWASMNATTGKNPSLEVAVNELRAWEADVVLRNQRTAPKVLGSAGGSAAFAAPPEPKKLLSDDERLAAAMELGRQLTQQG
jgi:hypothetical protein